MDGVVVVGSSGKSFETVKLLGAQDAQGRVETPAGSDFLRADFSRSGPDLLIHTPDGNAFLVPAYFMAETPPALVTHGGAVLSAKLVTALAGPLAPGMVAQAAAQQGGPLGASIGQVSDASGQVTVTHPDGSQETLTTGGSVYQGDVLETGAGANVSIVFLDDTVFSLDESGRMVMDEMVYDPGTQTGVFNAQVVQGVFSFVSGQVAKTSPDGMVVTTPTSTIGIRGSTVLGQAGPEGLANRFTLMSDVDGNVGELTLTNGGGIMVLNQPGASTTVFSFNAPPSAPVFLSPVEIQQNYGAALTKLVQVVAQKATNDANRAQEKAQEVEQEAQQAQAEAQQADEGAQQADAEAQQADADAAQAEAEAAAAQAEAEAALAAAAQENNPEAAAKAQAAEAKAAAAVAKAAETKAAAEAKIAAAQQVKAVAAEKAQLAAAKGAEAIKAQADVQKAVQFTNLAKTAMTTQVQAFDQVAKAGLLPPGMAEKAATIVDQATKFATDLGAKFAGDTADQIASDIAAQAAADAAAKAMGQLFNTVDPLTGQTNPFGVTNPFGTSADTQFGQPVDLFDYFDTTSLYNLFATYDPYGVINYFVDDNTDTPLVTTFGETLIAPATGVTLTGTALNSNFYFAMPNLSGTYHVSDAGGVNQISIDNLDNINMYVTASSNTSGTAEIWGAAHNGATASGSALVTIDYSNIAQVMLADASVAEFATINFITQPTASVFVMSGLQANQKGYVAAGTSAADTFTINDTTTTNDNTTATSAMVFGKDGADTFIVAATSPAKLMLVGGSSGNDDIFNYSAYTSTLYVYFKDYNTVNVQNVAYNSETAPAFQHELRNVGTFIGSTAADTLVVSGSTYASITIDGNGGNDTIVSGAAGDTIIGGAGADSLTGGSGADIFKYAATTDGGDTIHDFVTGYDKLNFTTAAFGGVAGTLTTNDFISGAGAVALTAAQHFIYDTSAHSLSYDADGNGAGTAVTIATMTVYDTSANSANLTYTDIVLV